MQKITSKKIDGHLKKAMLSIHEYGFVILFHTVWLLGTWLSNHQYRPLESFQNRIISIASANLLNASDRMGLAFETLTATILVISIIFYCVYTLRKIVSDSTIVTLQASSFVGILLFFFRIFVPDIPVLILAYWIITIQICSVVGSMASKYSPKLSFTTTPVYATWISIIALSLTVFTYTLQQIFNKKSLLSFISDSAATFATYVALAFTFSILWRLYYPKKYLVEKSDESFLSLLFLSTLPFTLLLMSPFLSIELPIIAHNYSLQISSNGVLTAIVPILFLLSFGLLFLRKRIEHLESSRILFSIYFPLFIFAIGILRWYSPTITPLTDMFEPANPGLMIQQFFDFGKIPFLETFNAHGLSDGLWGFIHAFINGYDVYSWMRYDFFQRIVELLVIYFFLKKITANAYMALSTVLFFPFLEVLFPQFFTICLLFLYLLIKTLFSKRIVSYIIFTLATIVFFLWKIDIAVSSILAVVATIILASTASIKLPIKWRSLGLAFIGVGSVIFLIFVFLCIKMDIPMIQWLRTFIRVLDSNQTFAVLDLYDQENNYSTWSYLVMPFILILSVMILIIQNRLQQLTIQKTVLLSYLFLTIFTLINLCLRGTIRHTLTENTTNIVSTFSFLLLGGIVFFSTKKYGMYIRFTSFIVVSTFLIQGFSLPTKSLQKDGSLLPQTITSLDKKHQKIKKGSASKELVQKNNTYTSSNEFIEFIKEQLTSEETFFDFSTSPMLYAFTHKKTPFYTNHLMLMDGAYLQDQVLKQLRTHDIPVVVFSYTKPYVYDLDGIPFQLRYYKITEYIYQNYHPFTVLDNREIWTRNDWIPKTSSSEKLQNYTHSLETVRTNQITRDSTRNNMFQANGADPFISGIIQKDSPVLNKDSYYYVKIQGISTVGGPIQTFYNINNSGFNETKSRTLFTAGKNTLYFPITGIKDGDILNDIRIDIPDKDTFTFDSIDFVTSKHPIYNHLDHSMLSQDFQTKYIPYLWGTYDTIDTSKLPVVREITPSTTDIPYKNLISSLSNVQQYEFEPLSSDEKKNGMYIVLRLKVEAKNQKIINTKSAISEENLVLHFGDETKENGSIHFSALRDGKSHRYAIRISSQYSWKEYQNSQILIETTRGSHVKLESISLVKADE